MLVINLVPIIIEFSRLLWMTLVRWSRLNCRRYVNKEKQNCPFFCFKIKYFLIGRTKTYNEHLFIEMAHNLNLKILEKRASFQENHEKKLYYNKLIIAI